MKLQNGNIRILVEGIARGKIVSVTDKGEYYETELRKYPKSKVEDIEKLIYSCGFYKTKAKDIKGLAIMIRDNFDGKVPDSIEKLTTLPGVGRKTANLIMGDVYKQPAVVADTHLIRITNLLGLVNSKDPKTVELELKKILPPEESNDFCHRIVLHGRKICIARRPKCDECILSGICKYNKNNKKVKEWLKD